MYKKNVDLLVIVWVVSVICAVIYGFKCFKKEINSDNKNNTETTITETKEEDNNTHILNVPDTIPQKEI
ncbi:MAG: hypothetical protein E7311_06245 [Clostridiales bacterium]|nr:hypothetical protein [Clostridiales bacterium]